MHRGRLWAAILCVAMASVGAARGEDGALAVPELPELIALELDPEAEADVTPLVDCSDGRPDADCLSGRLGSHQVNQQCGGIAVMFGVSSCAVQCSAGYYACGKCGWGGFAMCTCRANYTCDPYRP